MEFRYVDMRGTIPSGGSAKVTIPIELVEENWKKVRYDVPHDRKSGKRIDRFPICFIQENGRVLLELPENIVKSKDYPEELRNKVNEDWLRYCRRLVAEECDELYVKFARGKISEWELEAQFSSFKENFKEMARSDRKVFSERELHFIASDELGQLLAMISMDVEREKEENLLSLIGDVKRFKDELDSIKNILKQLEQGLAENRISVKRYEELKERYNGKLALAEERLGKLKSIICDG